ncbi:AAA family ATPase, partial [candidate division KSB1 bacterium]|nr:AAA family ATPase [candidate division KSB1 bacterium]
MSYVVLARKWRPMKFEEVVAQGHITTTLSNAIKSDRLASAYLFSGPRGVGKTTTARIFAKAINCDKGPTPTPCNECSSCTEITGSRSLDVFEIDGASNRGIDEVRNLRENLRYAATK